MVSTKDFQSLNLGSIPNRAMRVPFRLVFEGNDYERVPALCDNR